MRIILFVLTIMAFIAGGSILATAKSAIHEIEAFVLFLIAAVFLSGAAIVESVNRLHEELTTKNNGEDPNDLDKGQRPRAVGSVYPNRPNGTSARPTVKESEIITQDKANLKTYVIK